MTDSYDTIGKRATQGIKDNSKQKGRSIALECALLGINETSLREWKKGECNPSAYFLQQMALAGYDVMWILTGKR